MSEQEEIKSLKRKIQEFDASHKALDGFYGELIRTAHDYRTRWLLALDDMARVSAERDQYKRQYDELVKKNESPLVSLEEDQGVLQSTVSEIAA